MVSVRHCDDGLPTIYRDRQMIYVCRGAGGFWMRHSFPCIHGTAAYRRLHFGINRKVSCIWCHLKEKCFRWTLPHTQTHIHTLQTMLAPEFLVSKPLYRQTYTRRVGYGAPTTHKHINLFYAKVPLNSGII